MQPAIKTGYDAEQTKTVFALHYNSDRFVENLDMIRPVEEKRVQRDHLTQKVRNSRNTT